MFISRDTRRLIKNLSPFYTKSALAKDLAKAVMTGEGKGERWRAAAQLEEISSRFGKKPMLQSLWNAYYQLAELYALTHQRIGDKVSTNAEHEYAGDAALYRYRSKAKRRAAYEATTQLVLPGGVSPDFTRFSKKEVPLSEICRTPERQFAEMYAVIVGMEKYAESVGWQAYFWTFTAPGEYHSNPANKAKNYKGFTPFQAHEWISDRFSKVRALFAKHDLPLLGLRVVEVHQDGCPHWHVVLFYPPELANDFEKHIKRHLSRADVTTSEKNSVTCMAADKKKGRAATYAFKYLQKNTDDSLEGQSVRAQLALWGIRQYAWFGNINISLWRKLRSAPDFEKISGLYPEGDGVSPRSRLIAMWRACRRGDFYSFMILNGGIRRNPYKISTNLSQSVYRSLGMVKPANVPWPIKYLMPKQKTHIALECLPVGFDGWTVDNPKSKDKDCASTAPDSLDISNIFEKNNKKVFSEQSVTVIPNDSRKSKAKPYYTSVPGWGRYGRRWQIWLFGLGLQVMMFALALSVTVLLCFSSALATTNVDPPFSWRSLFESASQKYKPFGATFFTGAQSCCTAIWSKGINQGSGHLHQTAEDRLGAGSQMALAGSEVHLAESLRMNGKEVGNY